MDKMQSAAILVLSAFPLLAGVGGAWREPQTMARSPQPVPEKVRQACDLVAAIARETKGTTVTRRTGTFRDEIEGHDRVGCSVLVTGSTAALKGAANVVERWRDNLATRLWKEDVRYGADGPDGTSFAYVKDGVICIFRGDWDGGDDADPSYKPRDPYTGRAHCAAAAPRAMR
jgi:hypothetical protein